MAPLPAPSPAAPVIRQQAVAQSSAPAREIQAAMPLQSLTTSRVLAVLVTTISGGARSHIPSSQVWEQIPLTGTGGYARLGNLLVSAWWSRPGVSVYSAGIFQIAGMLGLAPEYATLLAFEIQDMQEGSILELGQSWSTSLSNQISSQAVAVGQAVRGVIAVGIAEDHHTFTAPANGRRMLTQTAASGFFAAPFSVAGTYATQSSNDPQDVVLPFDGIASPAGLLLFNVVTGSNTVTSLEAQNTTDSFMAVPGASITISSFLSPGGSVPYLTDSYLAFQAMTVQSSTDSDLTAALTATIVAEAVLYAQHAQTLSTDSKLDQYLAVTEIVSVELLGTVSLASAGDAVVVFSPEIAGAGNSWLLGDLYHLTDAYIFAGQSMHLADALLMSTPTDAHTTSSFAVTTVSSSHDADSYLLPTDPPNATHTTSSAISIDNIIGTTGWELRDHNLECNHTFSPVYSSSVLSVTSSAKRTGSQGGYGLRIDNNITGADSYWVPSHNSKALLDIYSTLDYPNQAASVYREIWTTVYFRCNNLPTDAMEQLISDNTAALGFDPFGSLISGPAYWVGIGTLFGSGSLAIYRGNSDPLAAYLFNDSNWHLLEVRLESTDSNPLVNSSISHPFLIEVYLDRQLIMSAYSYYSCLGCQILGIQQRKGNTHYQVDFDDLVISTNRVSNYDLSVIAKPAKANGNYNAWTSTPAGDYTDVASIPYDVAKHKDSTASGQASTVKVYSGGDTNPYPGTVHAAALHAVTQFNTNSTDKNLALVIREGGTDLTLKTWPPNNISRAYADRTVTCSFSPIAGSLWASAIYDFELGVKQVVDNGANRTVLIAASLLVSPFSYDHLTDADLVGSASNNHSTDADLGRSWSHTTDSLLAEQGYPIYTDALLSGDTTITHAADAGLTSSVDLIHSTDLFIDKSIVHSTDAVIVDVRGSVHLTDALLQGSADSYHDADAIVQALVDRPHMTDAIPYRLVEIIHNANSALMMTGEAAHTTNSRQIATISATHTTTSLKKLAISATHTADSLKYLQQSITHNTSSIKQGELTATSTSSSALAATNVVALLHLTVSTLQSTFTATETTDTFLKKSPTSSFTADADLFGSTQASGTTSSWIVIPTAVYRSHTTDAGLSGSVVVTVTTDSLLRSTFTQTHTGTSFLQLRPELAVNTDSLLQILRSNYHRTDTFLQISPTQTNTVDVLLVKTMSLSFTTSMAIAGSVDLGHLADGGLFGQVDMSSTTQSLLVKATSSNWSVDAYLAFEKLFTADSLVGLAAQAQQVMASSIFGQAGINHSSSSVVYVTSNATSATDTDLLGQPTLVFTTTVALSGTAAVQSNTDTKLATESEHTADADTFGSTGSPHSADSMLTNSDRGIFENEPTEPPGLFDGAF